MYHTISYLRLGGSHEKLAIPYTRLSRRVQWKLVFSESSESAGARPVGQLERDRSTKPSTISCNSKNRRNTLSTILLVENVWLPSTGSIKFLRRIHVHCEVCCERVVERMVRDGRVENVISSTREFFRIYRMALSVEN